MGVDIDIGVLRADIVRYTTTYAATVCQAAADKADKIAKLAIEQFYQEYTPKYYDRTENFKYKTHKRYYKNNGKSAFGGILVGNIGMAEYKYGKLSASEIGSMAWNGSHGGYVQYFPLSTKVAMELGLLIPYFENAGITAAKKQNYVYLFK